MPSETDTLAPAAFDGAFASAVLSGLSAKPKAIPCRFLYDARGSALFEDITRLKEYYPTRTEIGLLEAHAPEIAARAAPDTALVEFGSGSSRKTEILLEHFEKLSAYLPIDISETALEGAQARLETRFPHIRVLPVAGDFTAPMDLPDAVQDKPKTGFFPGSTIGNFSRGDAVDFLSNAAGLLGTGASFLVGVDLKKDRRRLLAAYNDSQGVTAAFNLNLLHRINRELDGTFDAGQFAHEAVFNAEAGRIEMHLVSLKAQTAHVLGQPFAFSEGERIHTENSHKYTVGGFHDLADEAGWASRQTWVDDEELFSLHELVAV